jgi:hypothetical protein
MITGTNRTESEREPEMGLSFEKIWAMFQETDRKFQETDRLIKGIAQEIRESQKETDRKISNLGGRLGELVEHLIAPNMLEKFRLKGYQFGKISPDVRIKDSKLLLVAEIDLLLENGDVMMAVEVKTKLTIDDVRGHIERMGKLRRCADEHQDSRKLIGAVAGAIIPEGVKSFAIKSGFYVIEQSGDTARIDTPEGFEPKVW